MRKSDYPNAHRRWVAVMVILLLLCLLVSVSVCESADCELGYTSGIWTDVEGGWGVTGIDTHKICWGGSTAKSCYRFDDAPAQTFNFDEPFSVGTFWHFNWPIPHGSGIKWADLEVTLHFIEPPVSSDPTFTFKFEHDETRNYACSSGKCAHTPCIDPGCPDKVTFPSAYPEETFVIGDKIYIRAQDHRI